jgi:hypothetical protein
MKSMQVLLAVGLILGVVTATATADVVAIHRTGTSVYAGPDISSVFKGAITVYTDASTGQDMVDDAPLWNVNQYARYRNYGISPTSIQNESILLKFKVSQLPGFVGGLINKAELQLYFTGGNTNPPVAQVISQDWAEGNKNDSYPGLPTAAAGCSIAHPLGLNTNYDQAADGTPQVNAASWGAGSTMFSPSTDVSGVTFGGTYGFNYTGTPYSGDGTYDGTCKFDVTMIVQSWANGSPNYGFHISVGNMVFCMTECGGDYQPVLFIDYTPNAVPSAITDLAAGAADWYKVDLTWTAPSDVPPGPVNHYEVRYSTSTITEGNWSSATLASNPPTPGNPGTQEAFTVTGLSANTTYYFAVKSFDGTGLVSGLSNVVSKTTGPPDTTAPAAISTLAVADTRPNSVTVSWTSPGDDNTTGTAAQYDLRYSTSPINAGNFASAVQVIGEPAPLVAGSLQSMKVTGLNPSTTYYFAIKTADEVPNWSGISNVANTTTLAPDTQAPNAITDLGIGSVNIKTISIHWTTPSDNGTAGLASYEVRYSTSTITEGNWSSATVASNPPTPGGPGDPVTMMITNLTPATTYYFAVKSTDQAIPANTSAISNVASGTTLPPIQPVVVHNPWLKNDRVADTHNLTTMAQTYINSYTPDGVVPPADNQAKAINIYDNQKRRLYHWGVEPPSLPGYDINDPTYTQNIFGWSLCGRHASQACTISQAAGLTQRKIALPGHWIYEVQYDGAWHALDTMCTMWVKNRANPAKLCSCQDMKNDTTLLANAAADGRACPGLLLCGDTIPDYQGMLNGWSDAGSGAATANWTGNMDLRFGQSFKRTWESWLNQHPTSTINADSLPGNDPPYHHEANKDYKDTVNILYWEPYALNQTQNAALNIGHSISYRRWANGTDTLTPDFRSAGYQSMLYSSTNIKTYNDDYLTPDLHVNAVGTPAEAVFKIALPFYITDANISGTFYRHDAQDVNKIYISTDGTFYTQVWENTASGTTQLSNLNIRNNVFGTMTYYVKVQLQADGSMTDAGVSNLVITTTFEHNKGAMAYLDKGTNNLTFTFDNPAELVGSSTTVHIYYKWKEYDGADWTIDKFYETYTTTSPTNFTINVGGSKVPRTEYILVELVPIPAPDVTGPQPITNLTTSRPGSVCVDLNWTAPGDDWDTGTATSYDIRYSTSLITAANWSSATQVTGEPAPKAAGSAETFQVRGLNPNTTYYFAIKTSDEVPNTSGLSNVASATTDPPDSTAPGTITDLAAAAGGTAGTINLTWTAPGDDGNTGTARTYDIRYSTSPINAGNFSSATAVSNPPTPRAAGSSESFTLTGVPTGVVYYFAIKTSDEVPNVSALSNVASAKSVLGDIWLQNGLNGYSGCQDAYISKAAETTNYDGYSYTIVCGFSDQDTTNRRRTILKFDLTSIPTNAVITQAKLYLYAYANEQHDPAGGYYTANRVYTPWSASSVTWNMPWVDYGGGDIESTPDAQVAKQTATGVWYVFDVTSRVQNFIANPSNNNGWVIKCLNEQNHNQDYFYACESSNTTLRPKLFITDVGNVITTACSPTNGGSVTGGGTYDTGQQCTLTATPVGQFVFHHWSGAPVDGSTSNPVTFTVNSSATITAVFTSTDVTAPAAVSNLSATAGGGTGSVSLSWTAPGDDGTSGTAYAYDVRYSTSAINEGNFAAATAVSGIGAPKAAGELETYVVSGLTNGTTYYFALKTRDEVPNWSALSNVVSAVPVMGDRVFQNGLNGYTGCSDSYMSAGSPTNNYGTNTRMSVTGYADQGATNVQRGLVKFDVSSIPSGTTIARATLYLYSYQVTGSTGYYGAYALTRNFTANGVTWNTYDGTNAWTTAGGDFNGTADGTSPKQSVANVWYAFDVTSRVQQWINNPSSNYGWVIKCTDENLHNQDYFYQSDYATDTSLRPKLVVSDVSGFAVTTASSPTAGGTVTGGGNYQSGQNCTLTAYPATTYGYTFDHWSGGPVNGQTNNPVTFSVTGDVTITAVFTGPAGYIDVANYTELKTAIQTTAVAGNTIRVHSGTYTMPTQDNKLSLNNHGNVGQPITVIGVGASRPILTTSGQNIDRGFFYSNSADSNWVFENLEFQNIHDAVAGNAAASYILGDNVTFRNCKIHDCDQGFSSAAGAANTLVEYCEIYNCNTSVDPGYAHLMYMISDSLTVRGCYLHNANYGQCLKTRSITNLIEYNWLDTDGSEGFVAGVASGNGSNSLFRGNVFVKRSATGGQRGIFYVYDTSGSISGTVTMINNTFISATSSDIYLIHNTGSSANVVLKNNIFAGPSDNLLSWNVPYSQLSGNNNAVKPGMTVPAELTGSIVTSDPGFVNLSTRDLHLVSGSACRDVGQNNPTYLNSSGQWVDGTPTYEPTKLMSVTSRFADATLDCGAYEYTPPVPSVQFSAASSSNGESTTSVNIPVTLSYASGSTVTVQYAVTGGTATGGGVDYTLAAGQLTFVPSDTSENIPVTINNDALDEDDETIVITLSNPTNAVLGATTTHTYTITDDDSAPTVQFAATSSQGSESVTSVNLAVTLSAASGKTVTVQYAATGGTATSPADYTISGTQLTFNPGVTSQNVPITVVDDSTSEMDETIQVTLSSPSNATLGTNTVHTYTIQDNDMPTVQFSATSSNGAESTTSVNLAVTLSASSSQTVTVQYAVTGGTATSPADYTISGTQLTFNPGVTSQNVPITVVNDTMDEDDETIVVTLSSPVNATLGTNTTHTYTITDDDNPPTVQFSSTGSSGAESSTSVNLAVTLSAASGKTVTVNYAATGGTATSPADYAISGTQLTFNPGVTSQNVPVTVVDDSLDEDDETVVVTLSSPNNATLGANTTHTYTIQDNDAAPTVQFSATSSAGDESVASVNLEVTLSAVSGRTVTVQYAATGGTATSPADYTISGTQLTFSPGVTSQNVPITVVDDSGDEPNETIVVTLSSPNNATLGTNTTHTYTIQDNDPGVLQVGPGKTYATVQDAVTAAVAGDTIEIYPSTYTQSAGWATVNKNNLTIRGVGAPRPILDANGSCLSGKGIFVVDGTNLTVENLEFKNARNPTDKNAAAIRLQATGLTVRNCYIHDNDDGILTNDGIGGNILLESSEFDHNGYGNGSSHNIYINPVNTLTIRYCYFHDANVGHEIKSRAAANYILYNRIGNEGGNGSYEVQLANGGTSYIIGNQIEQSSTSGNSGIINYASEGLSADNHLYVVNNTIVNNRTTGTFVYNASTTEALLQNNIFQGPGTVLSGPGTQVTNWATANAYLLDPVNYDFHLTASSTGAIDAGTTPGTGINGFNMNPVSQYVHPCTCETRPSSGAIDIGGFEYAAPAPTVQFSTTSSGDSESTTTVNLVVTLSASSSQTITVDYAVTGGTATGGGVDYTISGTQLTFEPGQTSRNVPITVVDDGLDELDETIVVTLSNPTNATLGANATHTYTIQDNDGAPTVQFSTASSSGSEGTTSVNLAVTLSTASSFTVTVNYAVTGGTATSPDDYSISGTQLTFDPGVTSQNVPITVVDDGQDEPDETIVVTLSSPANATLGTNTVHTYTIIDNDEPVLPVVQFSTTSSNGAESVTPANLVVTLSQSYSQQVTVKYNVTGGTATQGTDYTLPTGPVGGIVAIKRSAGLTIPTGLSTQFANAINGATIQVYSGAGMVGDTDIYFSLTWAQFANYQNYGGAAQVQYGNFPIFAKFNLAALPGFSGSTINKAELRYYYTNGNTGMANTGYIISSDWIEGTQTGGYPGAGGGLSAAHPMGYNTGADQNASGGTTPPLQSWANNDYFDFSKDVSSTTVGRAFYGYSGGGDQWGGFVVMDVTAFVQLFANGTPNYGFCTMDPTWNNYNIQFSETSKGAEYQPVLCVDYTAVSVSDTVVFEPGQTSKTIPITIIDDSTPEPNETIQVTLSNPTNATLGANTVHTYTINDNDVVIPTVQFQAATSNGSEATTSVNIPVTLSAATTATVTVNYAVTGGTATGGGTDYTLAAGQLTFVPSDTSENIPVTINNDTLDEVDETIIVTLSSPTNATLGSPTSHTYTINDDDAAPTVAFSTTSSNGSEATANVNLAVTLSAASGQTVTVNYAATGGTATSPADYTISGTSLTFNPGETSKNVPITVVDDALVEGNETIIVTLSNPTNATLGANTTHTYTINDNDAAPTFVAAGSVASGTGTITPALPAGLQTNDILLLFVETANQTVSISNPNGGTWTQVTNSPQGTGTAGGTAATRLTAFWSRYNGTQGAPTVSDSGDHQLGRMIAIRGATTSGDPCDVTAGSVEATSDTSGSIPGATTTVGYDLVVLAIATSLPDANGTANFSGWTNGDLTGLTERTDNTTNAGNGGGLAIATGTKTAAGVYGATAVTCANAAVKGLMSIAIKP